MHMHTNAHAHTCTGSHAVIIVIFFSSPCWLWCVKARRGAATELQRAGGPYLLASLLCKLEQVGHRVRVKGQYKYEGYCSSAVCKDSIQLEGLGLHIARPQRHVHEPLQGGW